MSSRRLTIAAAILIAGLAGVLLLVWGIYVWVSTMEAEPAAPAAALEPAAAPPPEPKLDPRQPQTLKELQSVQRLRLKSYGWTDRRKGIAHIPIDRAVEELKRKGFAGLQTGERSKSGEW